MWHSNESSILWLKLPVLQTGNDVFTVSQLNQRAKQLLEITFTSVKVEGEISNLSRPSSGHWYFTLKDKGAQVRCAMFRSRTAQVKFQPKEIKETTAAIPIKIPIMVSKVLVFLILKLLKE